VATASTVDVSEEEIMRTRFITAAIAALVCLIAIPDTALAFRSTGCSGCHME
jgi:hypothetical protein